MGLLGSGQAEHALEDGERLCEDGLSDTELHAIGGLQDNVCVRAVEGRWWVFAQRARCQLHCVRSAIFADTKLWHCWQVRHNGNCKCMPFHAYSLHMGAKPVGVLSGA